MDLQVNGFAGVDFNAPPITEEDLLLVIQALIREGVTSFLPTLITNSVEQICLLLENLDALSTDNPYIDSFIPGIHLEGPFISPVEGARGAHPVEHVQAPDWELFQRFQRAAGNRIRLITLSPEWPEAIPFIEQCVSTGVKVAIGHTIASPTQIQRAVEAGASLSTHLGNGAPLQLPRNNNFIIQQLVEERLAASIIADGFHLPNSFIQLAMKAKGEKLILVSDSTQFAGMPPGIYPTHIGGKVVLTEEGRLHMEATPEMLAGSAVSLLHCVNHLIGHELCSIEEAWEMGSVRPQQYISDALGRDGNYVGNDHVLFTLIDKRIEVKAIIKAGKWVYPQDLW